MTQNPSISGHPFLATDSDQPPGPLNAFLGWWGAELHAMLGGLTGSRLPELHWTGEGFTDASGKALYRYPTQAALVWPADRVLRRTLTLPMAAENNLAEALRFELGRHLPFPVDQAVYKYQIVARDMVKGQITAQATVIRRDEVQAALNHAHSAGFRLTGLIAGGEVIKGRPRRPWSGLEKLLGACLLVALAAAVAVPASIYDQRIAQLTSIEQGLLRRLDSARAVAMSRQAPALVLAGLAAERRARPSPLLLIEDLTRRLPDEVWVRFMALEDTTLKLEGAAASAAGLVSQLEASDWISGVQFLSPAVIDPITGLERFRLTAEVSPVWPDDPGAGQ